MTLLHHNFESFKITNHRSYSHQKYRSCHRLQVTHVPLQEAESGPGDGLVLAHQETAGVTRMLLGSVLTMLPVLTYGAMQAGQGWAV